MMKYTYFTLILIISVIIVSGCGGLSTKEKNAYYQKAIPIGQEYFLKYYDVEIEFNEYQILLPMSSTIVLKGHVKEDPKIRVSLSLFLPSLEVDSEGGPGEFIQKRKSEEEVNSK